MTIGLDQATVTSLLIDGVDRCGVRAPLSVIDCVNCNGHTRLETTPHAVNDMGSTD